MSIRLSVLTVVLALAAAGALVLVATMEVGSPDGARAQLVEVTGTPTAASFPNTGTPTPAEFPATWTPVPAWTPTPAPALPCGDVTGDGRVGLADLRLVLMHLWAREGQRRYDPALDLNGDGVIGFLDFFIVLVQLGTSC